MADKNYVVKTPLRRNTAGKGAKGSLIEPGQVVAMDEKIAEPLVKCGALEVQVEKKAAAAPAK